MKIRLFIEFEILTVLLLILFFTNIDDKEIVFLEDIPNDEIKFDEDEGNGFEPVVDTLYRMGPVLLKVDDDWLFDVSDKKFIRIGFLKKGATKNLYDYEDLSPKFLSSNTSETVVCEDLGFKTDRKEINTFDIEITNHKIWIDLYFTILNYYENIHVGSRIILLPDKNIFIYCPKNQKWIGIGKGYRLDAIERMLFTEVYNEKNSKSDVEALFKKLASDDNKIITDIINKRTLILPSINFLVEKILSSKKAITYSWFMEKEEVAPKDTNNE